MNSSPSTRRRRARSHSLEMLEARIAPATLVSLNSNTHELTMMGDFVDDGSATVQAGAPENLSFSVNAGNLIITDPVHHVTSGGAGVLQTANGQVSISIASLTGDLTIETGTGADSLTFGGTLTLAAGHSVTAHTTGTITFNNGSGLAASGTGGLSFSGQSVSGSADLATGGGLVVSNTDAASTLSGVISGGALTKNGSGTLLLSGQNSYASTSVNGGTLMVGASGALPNGSALSLNNTSILDLNGFTTTIGVLAGATGTTVTSSVPGAVGFSAGGSIDSTFSGVIQDGAGVVSLSKGGTGKLTLDNQNLYSGATTILTGILHIGNGGTGGTLGSGPVTNDAVLRFNRGDAITVSNAIGGSGDLSQDGFALTLSGSNTYSGVTGVFSGTLTLGSATALGSTAGGTVVNGGTLDLGGQTVGAEPLSLTGVGSLNAALTNLSATPASFGGLVTLAGPATIGGDQSGLTLTNIVQGNSSASLTKVLSDKLTLSTENSYTGDTIVDGGTLALVSSTSNNNIVSSALVVLRTGTTLDVTGLTTVDGAQTLFLDPAQTLNATNATVNGSLGGAGLIQPGGGGTVGKLTINGDLSGNVFISFDVLAPYAVGGTDFDQLVVSGNVDLAQASLQFTGGTIPLLSNTPLKLIDHTGAGPVSPGPAPNPPDGSTISIGHAYFVFSYIGGDGNDVTLTMPVGLTSVGATLAAGQLTISDTDAVGRPNHLTVFSSSGELVITDAIDFFIAAPAGGALRTGGHTLAIPLSKIAKGVVINGGGGDDSLLVDFSGLGPLPAGGLTFNGGTQTSAAGDSLLIQGGGQGADTYTFANAHDGSVVSSAFGKLNFTGLEPIVNFGTASNIVFNLPAGPNSATLDDGAGAGNQLTRLSGSTFEQTDFSLATSGKLTINRGSATDTLALINLPASIPGDLTIGSPANPFDTVTINGTTGLGGLLNLAANHFSLAASQSLTSMGGTLTLGGGTIDGLIHGFGGLTVAAGGAGLVLNGANTFAGGTRLEGSVLLGVADALQNSTVNLVGSNLLHFANGIGQFDVDGLTGPGALALVDGAGAPVTLLVGNDNGDSAYAGSLTGAGSSLVKVGTGILTLTGANDVTTTIMGGTLQVNSDRALGHAGNTLTIKGGTLHALASFVTARPILLNGEAATFEASSGKTLTLSGVISGNGDLLIGDVGTVLVTGQSNTNTGAVELGGGPSQMVNGVTISSPGIHSGVMVMPGLVPNTLAMIDVTGVNVPVSLVVQSPKTGTVTVNQIVSTDQTAIKMISLGAHVVLGDGLPDTIPDLMINGKVTTLVTGDVNAHTIIQLGAGLAYLDTYKNLPNITLHDVLGAGVTIDLTGNGLSGLAGGIGGGGLGKVVVNSWAAPGVIMTTQGITSFTVKTGDSHASIEVDPLHHGTLTTGNVGLVSIPAGQWAGASMQVEGVVAQFLTKGLADGSTITAGAFGTVNIKGTYAGSLVAKYDASVNVLVKNKPARILATGAIGSVTISSGDFTGVINADGKVGNVSLTGTARFTGTLRGGSLGNITAASFTGTGATMGDPRHTITAIGSIGNITAKTGGLTDYIIAAGTDLGSDALFGGVADTFTSFFLNTPTVKTAVSIGTITIKGVVQGTTIAAGVDPGLDGVYGDANDLLVALPVEVTKTKVKIGALKFDSALPTLAFTDTPGFTVTDAFEAPNLTSVQLGAVKITTFDTAHYIDSGSASIIVRLLS